MILVVSPDWATRALLAAQLGETCDRPVVSAVGTAQAVTLTRLTHLAPALAVVDAGFDIGPDDVDRLMVAMPCLHVLLVASALRHAAFAELGNRCAGFLLRPVSVGAIAAAAARMLSERAGMLDEEERNRHQP